MLTRLILLVSVTLIAGCVERTRTSALDTTIIGSYRLSQWVGHTKPEVIAAWGEPQATKPMGQNSRLSYVSIAPRAMENIIESSKEKDWDQGPKFEGIDKDLLDVVVNGLKNSCFVNLVIDANGIVLSAELSRYKLAAPCYKGNIPLPPRS